MARILITDDNPQNLYLARYLLEQSGHTIDEAADGQQAIDLVFKNKFDLILMDIQMPVMDGIEATKQIKEASEQKIIALTAKAMAGDREAIMSSGFDGYIEKPINPQSFTTKVEEFL